MARRSRLDENHPLATEARQRAIDIIDEVDPRDLAALVKKVPSLRGIVSGNISELRFRKFAESHRAFSNFYKPDDHDRSENKIDLQFQYRGRTVSFQLKSIQTNSIKWDTANNTLVYDVQNDASDRRPVTLPNGHTIETTNYTYGDYDILAVPLFPLSGKWNFAYLLNEDCTTSTARKFSADDRQYLISTIEKLTYPLSGKWTDDIFKIIRLLFARRKISP